MKNNASLQQNRPYEQGTNKSFLTINKRIYLGFSITTLILVIATSLILFKVDNVKDFTQQVITTDLKKFDAYFDLNSALHKSQEAMYKWLLTHNDTYKIERQNAWVTIIDRINLLNKLIQDSNQNDSNKWKELTPLLTQLNELQVKLENTTSAENTSTETKMIEAEIAPILNKVSDYFDGPVGANHIRYGGIFDISFKTLENNSNKVFSDMQAVEVTLVSLLIIMIVSTILIAKFTSAAINRYINVFRQHSNNIANGDLSKRLTINSHDELGLLGNDLNLMTESLAKITQQINTVSQDMISTLEEVRQASDIQSSGATEQASSINEITSSLEEIEKSSMQTIDKAKSLGEVAERTREKGQLGLEAVEQSMQGMKAVREKVQTIAKTILELSNQTQQVGEITTVVNSLAQQSKMLALNASIEAAKAGDAGKGFAVVATEVKSLAEQSEQSTSQVQKILEDIRRATEKAVMATEEGIKGVDEGTNLVEETGQVVRNLTDAIREATIASQQIQAAIRQEGIGIEQITAGMNEINQVTYSYVESVKQTTEAINHLAMHVKNLKEYIDIYKI